MDNQPTFKLDENLPAEAGEVFRLAGYDAMSVPEQRLAGASDDVIAEVCRSESRILITLGWDFADIRTYPPGNHPGIVILRPRQQDKPGVLQLIQLFMPALTSDQISGKLCIVEPDKIRIRD